MTKAKMLMSLTAAALSLGFSLQPHPAPFWETNIVIAGEDTSPRENVQTNADSSAAKSAKMDEGTQTGGGTQTAGGTQTGGANQGTPPENDTQKIDQPPRQNPTTGD